MKIGHWHVGVAAEAFAAGAIARCGCDVSVQYGANQPEYDLIAVSRDKMLKISVKGSQDGGWGLTQGYKKNCSYHEAIDRWLQAHHKKTIFCLVQFLNVLETEMPRMYFATPEEIAARLKESAGGRGETILYEYHEWGNRAAGRGTVDKVPEEWKFSKSRLEEMLELYGE